MNLKSNQENFYVLTIGPALLQEAQNALTYSERMVSNWLKLRMFAQSEKTDDLAKETANFFRDASVHLSHGRRYR
jgi:hypothetical protein